MKIIDIKDVPYTDFTISEFTAIEKTVENAQTFKVYDSTRITSVFVYLKDCGIKYISSDGTELLAEKGSIIYIPQTAKYHVTYYSESKKYAIAQLVAFELHDEYKEKFIISERIIRLVDAANNIYADRFNRLTSICSENNTDNCEFKAVLYSIFSDIGKNTEKHQKLSKTYFLLAPCMSALQTSTLSELTVSSLACMCHISESCFRRTFKEHFGISPKEYIQKSKIQKAKELLQNSSLSINEISNLTGFNDTSYFTKAFKNECGISPTKYRAEFIL